jgi:hypothetical protein
MKYVAELEHVREITLAGDADDGPMLVIGAAGAFHGIRFQELSISRVIGEERAFMIAAFNSRRFFAWCERVFFKTPYVYGDVRVGPRSLSVPGVMRAEMREPRTPSSVGRDGWHGEVHLPGGRCFVAKLEGMTERYRVIDSDRFELTHPALRTFVPREWIVRADARHAKSKTYRREGDE